ncbi:MAG: hypothetical protein KDK08_23165, partial [Rhizobiaceae bacterium]|nr:hypothetical protein [Rhizobiaceae bacterium]
MTRYRTLLAAIFSLMLVLVGAVLSWTATWVTYKQWTGSGAIFSGEEVQVADETPLRNMNISGWDNLYTREYSHVGQYVSYKVFVENQFICEIVANINPQPTQSGEKLTISWRYGGGATNTNMKTLFGIDSSGSSADIFSLSEGPWFTPYTRQVWIGIPSGSFAPV